jgi:hypothetical protein
MNTNDQEQFSPDIDERISVKEVKLKWKEWKRFLRSKWRIILIAWLTGSSLGLAAALIKRPDFNAELAFSVQDDKTMGGMSSALGLASQFGIDLGGIGAGGEFSGDNLMELMTLRSMIEGALLTPITVYGKKQTLAELYISSSRLREKEGWEDDIATSGIHYLPGADRSKFSGKQDSMLNVLQDRIVKKNLTVEKTEKKLNIVYINVKSKDQYFSKYFAEALEEVVSDFYIKTKTEKGSKNVAVLQKQTDSVRRILNGAIEGVALSNDFNPKPNFARQRLRVPTARRQVDVQANTIILGELVKNLEMAKMSLLQSTPLLHVIYKPIVPLKKKDISIVLGIFVGGFVFLFLTLCALIWSKMSLRFDS